jgi:ketosteroid isomerase-like protein
VDELQHVLDVFRREQKPPATVEERLRRIEDETAIRELVLLYGYLCDAAAWDDLLDLYTDDIERTLGGTLSEHVAGKAKLRELYVQPMLPTADGNANLGGAALHSYTFRHLIIGTIVRVTESGDQAWASARGQLVGVDKGSAGFRRGVHEATWIFALRRQDDRWKIAKLWVYSEGAHNPLFAPS